MVLLKRQNGITWGTYNLALRPLFIRLFNLISLLFLLLLLALPLLFLLLLQFQHPRDLDILDLPLLIVIASHYMTQWLHEEPRHIIVKLIVLREVRNLPRIHFENVQFLKIFLDFFIVCEPIFVRNEARSSFLVEEYLIHVAGVVVVLRGRILVVEYLVQIDLELTGESLVIAELFVSSNAVVVAITVLCMNTSTS